MHLAPLLYLLPLGNASARMTIDPTAVFVEPFGGTSREEPWSWAQCQAAGS